MSEDITKKVEGSELPEEIKLEIVLGPKGVSVTGPMGDEILCYGLLEKARQVILSYASRQVMGNKGGIIKPTGGMSNLMRKKN